MIDWVSAPGPGHSGGSEVEFDKQSFVTLMAPFPFGDIGRIDGKIIDAAAVARDDPPIRGRDCFHGTSGSLLDPPPIK